MGFQCIQCGKCCLKYGNESLVTIGRREFNRFWDRPDVQRFCFEIMQDRLWDIWVHPDDIPLKRCPFLRKKNNSDKYYCRIYDIRPDVCRNYPVDYDQQLRDKCEGIIKFKMKEWTQFSQVLECDNPDEVNLLLGAGWLILETLPMKYDSGGFIRTLMGNPSIEKLEHAELMEYIGRTKRAKSFDEFEKQIYEDYEKTK